MKSLFDAYMVISYAMIVGCAVALVRDGKDTRYSFWAWVAAFFWPIAVSWMVWQSYLDYQREMGDSE